MCPSFIFSTLKLREHGNSILGRMTFTQVSGIQRRGDLGIIKAEVSVHSFRMIKKTFHLIGSKANSSEEQLASSQGQGIPEQVL
jgi:hypothetical protein